jgi:hypothetical protein
MCPGWTHSLAGALGGIRTPDPQIRSFFPAPCGNAHPIGISPPDVKDMPATSWFPVAMT